MVRVVDSGWADVGNAFTQSFRGAGDSYLKGVLTRSQYEQNMASAGKTQAELDQIRAREAIVNTRKAEIAKEYGQNVADDWEVMFRTGTNPESMSQGFFKSRGGYGVMSAPPTGANRRDMQLYTGANPTTGVDAGERAADDAAEIARVRAQQELANAGGLAQENLRQTGLNYRQTQEPLKLGQSETGYVPKPQQEALGLPGQTVRGSGAGTNFMETDANGRPTGRTIYSPDGVHDAAGQPLPERRVELTKDPASLAAAGAPPLGASIEAHAWDLLNKYRLKKASGAITSPGEDADYYSAYEHLRTKAQYQPKEIDLGNGYKQTQWVPVPNSGPDLGTYPMPAGFTSQQASPPAATGPAPPPPAQQGYVPPAPPPGDQAAIDRVIGPGGGQNILPPPAAQGASPTQQGGAGGGIPIDAATLKPTPETQQRMNIGGVQLTNLLPKVEQLFAPREQGGKGFRPERFGQALGSGSRGYTDEGFFNDLFRSGYRERQGTLYPDQQLYDQYQEAMLIPLLRLDTGAALNPSEKPWYRDALFPQFGDTEEVQAMKLDTLRWAVAARATATDPTFFARLNARANLTARNNRPFDPSMVEHGPPLDPSPFKEGPPPAASRRPPSSFALPGVGAAPPPPAAAAPPSPPAAAPQAAPKPKLQWDPKTGTVIEVR